MTKLEPNMTRFGNKKAEPPRKGAALRGFRKYPFEIRYNFILTQIGGIYNEQSNL